MPSIRDIHFDTFYEEASFWMFLVYQLDGLGLEISLPNAQLMSFIQPFENRQDCRNAVLEHNAKMIKLFAYCGDIEKWWIEHQNDMPFNVQEIYIFCKEEKDVLWMNTYTGRFKSKVREKFIYDRLDEKILYYAIGFIDNIKSEFEGENLTRLIDVRRNLCRALSRSLDEQSRN